MSAGCAQTRKVHLGERLAKCLRYVAAPDARVLILGSIPGERSIQLGQYYAHERNAFWPLMVAVFGGGDGIDYEERLNLLLRSRVALWDVLDSAERSGSLDSAIVSGTEAVNDIAGFLLSHPFVTHVFFNGAKAEALFNRHVLEELATRSLMYKRLPSTSPANASASFAQKLEQWQSVADAAFGSGLARLFVPEPSRWGLRGDPHLWREIRDAAFDAGTPLPAYDEELRRSMDLLIEEAVGRPLASDDPVFVERFAHGGMSSGMVSPQFWHERAIPLLLERLREKLEPPVSGCNIELEDQ